VNNRRTIAPISVVIPCYRCVDTIGRAVDSVLNQTVLPAEIILVDDASCDGTLGVLHSLAGPHEEFIRVVILTKNEGPGVARNAGWEVATNPWIAFLDADDTWHHQKIEIQWDWVRMHTDVVLCGHTSAVISSEREYSAERNPPARRINSLQMLIANRFPTRSVMIRREVPFRFRRYYFSEDYMLWLEIILSGLPAWQLEVPLAFSHRPEYSPGGCSGQLSRSFAGELTVIWTLRKERKISIITCTIATLWFLVKYLRRLIISHLRDR
jgi:teichuronic acid biosynthesis glycosyltransferase TuaG